MSIKTRLSPRSLQTVCTAHKSICNYAHCSDSNFSLFNFLVWKCLLGWYLKHELHEYISYHFNLNTFWRTSGTFRHSVSLGLFMLNRLIFYSSIWKKKKKKRACCNRINIIKKKTLRHRLSFIIKESIRSGCSGCTRIFGSIRSAYQLLAS